MKIDVIPEEDDDDLIVPPVNVRDGKVIEIPDDDDGDTIIKITFGPHDDHLLVSWGDELEVDSAITMTGAELGSAVIDLNLLTGQSDLENRAEICFEVPGLPDDACLGYIDDRGRWRCQDNCLKEEGDMLCGVTDHLTSFAVLLSGGDGQGGCNPTNNFITGTLIGDFWLVVSVMSSCWCCAVFIAYLGVRVPWLRRLIKGEESDEELRKYSNLAKAKELDALERAEPLVANDPTYDAYYDGWEDEEL